MALGRICGTQQNLWHSAELVTLTLQSQFGLRKFGARNWLGTAVILWGVIMLCMGFVKKWYQLAALRAILGVFEAALFPGAAYLISCWYPRRSMATRNSVFYITSSIAGAMSAPLGYCFTLMHGMRGLSGWAWAFIWYGIITILVGIVAYFALVDFPDRATFLTDEQKQLIRIRIDRDRGDAEHDPVTLRKIAVYCLDWKIWIFALLFCSSTVAAYSLAYFGPMILMSMGFNNVETLVLGAPTQFYSLIPGFITAYIADKYRNMRAWMIVFNCLCLIAGTAMYSQLQTKQKAARFAGIFLAVGGCNANVALILSWAQCSIRSQSKRGFTSAIVVAFGGIGGILASVLFMQKEAPRYKTGVYFTMAISALSIVATIILHVFYRIQNRRADRGLIVIEGKVGFRYQC